MGKSRKPEVTEQTSESAPWGPQIPHLTSIFGDAAGLYGQGPSQFYPGQTYADFNPWQTGALEGIANRAMNGNPILNQAQETAGGYLGNNPSLGGLGDYISQMMGGSNPFTLGGLSEFAGVGNMPGFSGGGGGGGGFGGGANAGLGTFGQLPHIPGIGQSGQLAGITPGQSLDDVMAMFKGGLTGLPQATIDALTQTAQGDNLMGNPFLDQTYNQASQQVTDRFNQEIAPNIAAQFSMAGRTGSGMNALAQGEAAGETSDALAQLSNSIYGGNYQRERDRQLGAANTLGGLSQNQQGLNLQALGMGSDFYNTQQGQDIQRRGLASQDELARLGLQSENYNQAGNRAVQNMASRRSASASRYGSRLGAETSRYLGQLTNDLGRRQLAGNMFTDLNNQFLGNQQHAAGLGAGIYNNQLGNQLGWGQLAQGLGQADYNDYEQLLRAGGILQGQDQRGIDEDVARHDFGQNADWNNLFRYLQAIQGNYGGTTDSTSTTSGGGGSPFSSMLGGLLSLGSMFIPGAGPAVAAAGASQMPRPGGF